MNKVKHTPPPWTPLYIAPTLPTTIISRENLVVALLEALTNLEKETSELWRIAAIAKVTNGLHETALVNVIRAARSAIAKAESEDL